MGQRRQSWGYHPGGRDRTGEQRRSCTSTIKNMNSRRGLNRLFLVFFVTWTIFCTVAYPIWLQLERQSEATQQHAKEVKACQESSRELDPSDYSNCFVLADERWQKTIEFFSLKKFYWWDVVFWKVLLPVVILPPLFLRLIASALTWVFRGFRTEQL